MTLATQSRSRGFLARAEAIILAGGFGTRVAAAAPGVPKALALVAGKPFLHWQLEFLRRSGFNRVVLATGYRADQIAAAVGDRFAGLEIAHVRESTPLGTGGAMRSAFSAIRGDSAYVFNGDTLAMIDCVALAGYGGERLVLTVARSGDAARFGGLVVRDARAVAMFERGQGGPAWINAGAYWVVRNLLEELPRRTAFSFEEDFLRPRLGELAPRVVQFEGPMIDIGTLESLAEAQQIIPRLLEARRCGDTVDGQA